MAVIHLRTHETILKTAEQLPNFLVSGMPVKN